MTAPAVSVCMATYRGAQFVGEQIASILEQLAPDDELVIVDDASPDDTVERVRALSDPRIRLITRAENRGYVATFAEAMAAARGEVIMLADQDDVWPPGRVSALVEGLQTHDVVCGQVALLDTGAPIPSPLGGGPWVLSAASADQPVRMFGRLLAGLAPYYGSAMALRRSVLSDVLPVPPWLHESHDIWIAAVAHVRRSMGHVEVPVVWRRLHDDNASSPRPRGIRAALASRWLLVKMWREARRRAA